MDDYKDKIAQIRARRHQEMQAGAASGSSKAAAYDPSQGIGAKPRPQQPVSSLGLKEVSDRNEPDIFEGIKSPWSVDRVRLSIDGQIAMMEQRSQMRVNVADLGYTNRIPILSLRPGLFVKVEPPGTYRLVYHNR